MVGHLVQPLDLVLELVGNRHHAIDAEGAMPFMVLDAVRLAAEEAVAVTAILGRVHGQHRLAAPAFLDPDDGVGRQPIMGMDHVEAADGVFHAVALVDEGPAHVVDLVHEVRRQRKAAAMVMDVVNAIIRRLPMSNASKDMDVVVPPLQGRRQLGHVSPNAAHGDGVQRFPREQRDAHGSFSPHDASSGCLADAFYVPPASVECHNTDSLAKGEPAFQERARKAG